MVAIAVMSSAVMQVLDTSVVNVSLPHIAGSLSSTVEEATWVLTSYLVANAIILPITGWIAGVLGRKRVLMMAVAGFTLSSLACGLAPNLPMLIVFRVIQGLTGGGLQPLSQAVLLEEFPGREQGKAMAFWSLGIIAAPILGPTLGGWITDTWTWRWVFFINLPVGVLSLLLISQYVYDPHYLQAPVAGRGCVGHRHVGRGHGRAADHARQGAGEGLVRIDPDSRAVRGCGGLPCGVRAARIARQGPDRALQADALAHLRFGHRAGHDHGVRALRQPGAAAALHADPAGLDGDDGGNLEQSARYRNRAVHAACGLSAGQRLGRAPLADRRLRRHGALLLLAMRG